MASKTLGMIAKSVEMREIDNQIHLNCSAPVADAVVNLIGATHIGLKLRSKSVMSVQMTGSEKPAHSPVEQNIRTVAYVVVSSTGGMMRFLNNWDEERYHYDFVIIVDTRIDDPVKN